MMEAEVRQKKGSDKQTEIEMFLLHIWLEQIFKIELFGL